MIYYDNPQGSPAWLESRKGVITGSRFKDCRDFNAPTAAEKKEGATRGKPSKAMLLYAKDVARERVGGKAGDNYQNAAMRFGTEQEPLARLAYEARTRNLVEEVGFYTTDDRMFGVSVDGLVGDDGIIEIKTMVSSDTLFTAVVDDDTSAYEDQCNGAMWLMGRQWIDLILWAPDLEPIGKQLTIKRIVRNDEFIQALEDDLMAFQKRVSEFEAKLIYKKEAQ